MRRAFKGSIIALLLMAGLVFTTTGCNWNRSNAASDEDQREREEKTREEVAKATERLKPELETAGRELNQAAEKAGDQLRAAAQGVRDGFDSGTAGPGARVDLNTASEKELTELPGITDRDARRIVRGRPYGDTHDLVSKGILSESSYLKIRDQIAAKETPPSLTH